MASTYSMADSWLPLYLPPLLLRRLVLAPVVVLLALITIWTIPLQLFVMVLLVLLPKVSRIIRVFTVLNFYVVM